MKTLNEMYIRIDARLGHTSALWAFAMIHMYLLYYRGDPTSKVG